MNEEHTPHELSPERLLRQLDRMVELGRVTQDEADRLRAATEPAEVEAVVREIRDRHAGERLRAAVERGRLTGAEADGLAARLRAGEDPRALRTRLDELGRSGARRNPGTDDGRP